MLQQKRHDEILKNCLFPKNPVLKKDDKNLAKNHIPLTGDYTDQNGGWYTILGT